MIGVPTFFGALAVSLSVSTHTLTSPVSNELIKSRISAYEANYEENRINRALTPEVLYTLAKDVFDGLDIPDLTFEQLAMLGDAGLFERAPVEVADAAVDRLETVTSEKTVDGARAAIFSALLSMTAQQELDTVLARFATVFSHPSIIDAMKTHPAEDLFGSLRMLQVDMSSIREEMIHFGLAITPDFYPQAAPLAASFYAKIREVASEEEADAIHANIIAWANSAKDSITDPNILRFLEGQITLMNSAFGQGKLIGYPAPELNFLWSSDGTTTKLSDHIGKVVVLDFWATWCGPCIASFPDLNKLRALYEGYPVEIIGVTSLQGRHFGQDGKVDTSENPEKEFELMKNYMKWKDISWNIAFTKQRVYNPDYGVMGIPHVTIIDPSGITRFNKVHDFDEQVSLINQLLSEANLKHPGVDRKE